MTQHEPAAAAAMNSASASAPPPSGLSSVVPAPASSSASPPATALLVTPPEQQPGTTVAAKTLREEIDAAMARLLGVSAKFRDLTGQDRHVSTREETVDMMQHYLRRLGLDAALDRLSVIHVAGTKGKGSTCAMTERILRAAGYKTGLFTSPHLISPCERIRINGRPIPEATFLRHFTAVWEGLERTAADSGVYPPMAWFFRFLTLLALDVFIAEEVDVVILEVGIGGRLDATNVFARPVVCGVTTLDLDHVRVLGSTIEQIAYAKAGIFKPGVPAFTTVGQEPAALAQLHQCAEETVTSLLEAPPLDAMGPNGPECELGMQGDYQRVNAGLAVALASTWLRTKRSGRDDRVFLTPEDFTTILEPVIRDGLRQAFWPARAHQLTDPTHPQRRFFIDGAHTLRSLEVCAEWFSKSAPRGEDSSMPHHHQALIFTIHYERNVASMITPLLALGFDRVYFCPTGASRPSLAKMHTFSEALRSAGLEAIVEQYAPEELAALDSVPAGPMQWQTTLGRLWAAMRRHFARQHGAPKPMGEIKVLPNVIQCIEDLRRWHEATPPTPTATQGEEGLRVLVTGSLYLAGETLDYLGWKE